MQCITVSLLDQLQVAFVRLNIGASLGAIASGQQGHRAVRWATRVQVREVSWQ